MSRTIVGRCSSGTCSRSWRISKRSNSAKECVFKCACMSRSALRARLNGCQLPGTSERTIPPHMPQVLTISIPRLLVVAPHGRGDALGTPLHEPYRQLFAEQERDNPASYGQPDLQRLSRHG